MYDICIIGAGPAGVTLARLLAKDHKIIVLEKKAYDDKNLNYEKCCGGLLDPDAQKVLASFHLGLPKQVLVSPQMFSVRAIDIDQKMERFYQRHYININRKKFEEWLISLVSNEVDMVFQSCFFDYKESEGIYTIFFHHKGEVKTIKTRMLVGADGAISKVRNKAYQNHPTPKRYVSIQESFQYDHSIAYYGAVFSKNVTDYYSWVIPKENEILLGSAIKQGIDVVQKFEYLKEQLLDYGFHFTAPIHRKGAYIYRPVNTRQICLGNKGIYLIGEAAGLISPSSAEGISYAFKSAIALSKAIRKSLENIDYQKESFGLKMNILLKNVKIPLMYQKNLRYLIMKSKLRSIKINDIDHRE